MKKILLVEDNAMNRELVKEILELSHYHLKCANNGIEALSLLDAELFDLILTDINLPKMNGIELIGKIREKESKHLKVIAMTSDNHTENGETFEEVGFDGFIQKPFKIHEFRDYVKSFIDGF